MNSPIAERAARPVAQYIRMSTEHQRYSPDNQQTAIAAYASVQGFEVTATYIDSGKSGLTLSGRPALKQMLSDVLSGTAPYQAILVLDVSRWGRFQDTDQSAHYEYMCREAGIPVHYCNEPFQNEGGTMSSIVKHMKRVMAAEFSRELSSKVSRAQRQQARLGFKQGGICAYGTRRQVIDDHGAPRMLLASGERKALQTDKVVVIWGPPEEIALVRRIYRLFVTDGMNLVTIARWLNARGHSQTHGAAWTGAAVRYVLRNELYRGRYVFGRKYMNVGAPRLASAGELVSVKVLTPIISERLFLEAESRLTSLPARIFSNTELLDGLKRLLAEKGSLSSYLIVRAAYLPYPDTYVRRFGSLPEAYALIGYEEPTERERRESRFYWSEEMLLDTLRRIYLEKGYVDGRAIGEDEAAPSRAIFSYRLGGLTNAMALAGLPVPAMSRRREAALLRQKEHHEQRKDNRKRKMMRTMRGSQIRDEELDAALRRLLVEHGYLSQLLIDSDTTIPSSSFFRNRLGGLKGAYARIGYLATQSEILRAANERSRQRLLSQ